MTDCKVDGKSFFFFLDGGGDVSTSSSTSSRLSVVTSRARALYFTGCCVTRPQSAKPKVYKMRMILNKFREPLIKEMLEQSTVAHPPRLDTALTGRRGTVLSVVA